MNVSDEIKKITDWYKNLPIDFLGINQLIFEKQRLVGFQEEFATELGMQKKIWTLSEAVYEKKKSQLKAKLLLSKRGTAESDAVSRANSVTEFTDMKEQEGVYYQMFYPYKTHEKTIEAMTQHIAKLRNEASKHGM